MTITKIFRNTNVKPVYTVNNSMQKNSVTKQDMDDK
jgi:hypothetical protein